MKNSILKLSLVIIIYALVSCSNNSQNKEQQTSDTTTSSTSSSSSLMADVKYDPLKIDPKAPVSKITLHARGNSMADMSFDMKEINVKAGSTVNLTLINDGTDISMQHNFVLIDDGTADAVAKEAIKAGPDANFIPKMNSVYIGTKVTLPGKTETITFPAPEKGSYEFICTYPGHYTKMRGKFVVE